MYVVVISMFEIVINKNSLETYHGVQVRSQTVLSPRYRHKHTLTHTRTHWHMAVYVWHASFKWTVKSMRSQREVELFWKPFSVSHGGVRARARTPASTHTQSGAAAASSVTSHTGYLKWRLHKEWADGCSVTRVHNRTHTHRLRLSSVTQLNIKIKASRTLRKHPKGKAVSKNVFSLLLLVSFNFTNSLQLPQASFGRCIVSLYFDLAVHQWNSNDESFPESEWIPALTGQVIYHLEWPTQ